VLARRQLDAGWSGLAGALDRGCPRDAEDADNHAPVLDRHRADLDRHTRPVATQDIDREIGHVGAEQLAAEFLAGEDRVLRRHDCGEVSADDVADEVASRVVEPGDAPLTVEDVDREAEVLERRKEARQRCVELGAAIFVTSTHT
jgi:hypothetical protein